MDYQQTLDYLFSQLPIFQRQGKTAFNKDLGKTLALCQAIGNPENKLKFIHVAGTNGKGSVCHMLASVLKEAGFKTGLYTSPHLLDFRERIRINGAFISKDFVVEFVAKHTSVIQEIKPSFFELTFAMSLDYFYEQNIDLVVLETGMGGRLDSTNVVNPILSIITNIGLDHQAYLGDTIEKIAREKAGIIKPKTPALLTDPNPEVVSVFKHACKEAESTEYYTNELVKVKGKTPTTISFNNEIIEVNCPLVADYQLQNMATVAAAFAILQPNMQLRLIHLKKGIERTQENFNLAGRWQKLSSHPNIICDVGHNEDGIKQILHQLKNEYYDQLHIVFGMVNDKDTKTLSLLPKNANYYLCQANIPRALPVDELTALMKSHGFNIKCGFKSVADSFEHAKEFAQKNDLILVAGSLFVVAEVLALFEN